MPVIRHLVLALGIVGSTFFALAFLASIAKPGFVEEVARNIIRYEIEKQVHEKIDTLDSSTLSDSALL
ncbi:hypothetical protein ACLIIZ_16760 [Azonexus caeni]|jgi:hypothetical protein|uniref:hypothetical protein n=1 Tax=Azonexus caeni TaxID=266126 RepID=UPI003A8C156D